MRLSRFKAVSATIPISVVLFISACSSPKTPAPPTAFVSQFKGLLPELMNNDSGLFHGIVLGMKPEEVKHFSIKGDSLSLEDKTTLILEGKPGEGKEYTYECQFDEKGLHTIILDVYLKNEPNSDSLLEDFRKYFTLKYGPSDESRDTYTWTVDRGVRPAKIQLQEDPGYPYGELTITFFDKTFDQEIPEGDSLIIP